MPLRASAHDRPADPGSAPASASNPASATASASKPGRPPRSPGTSETSPAAPPVPSRSVPESGNNRDSSVLLLDGVSEVPVTGSRVERIAAMASAQRGHVARRQLIAAEISASAIGRLVNARHLIPRHHGVYAVGHLAPVPGGPEAAALLTMRGGAALGNWTAAWWWTLEDERPPEGIHITLPGGGACGSAGVIVHRSTILTPRDVRIHDGLPVTAPARTLLDLAAECEPRKLERMLDTALVRRRVTLREINELLARAGRHAGRVTLRELVEAHTRTTFTRSEAEERFLALVREAGLPEPLVNVRRHGFELDFLWPGDRGRGLAVEIDGYAFHGGRLAFERDRRRDGILQRAGIDVLRLTWRRLTEEPLAVIAEVATILARLTTFAI